MTNRTLPWYTAEISAICSAANKLELQLAIAEFKFNKSTLPDIECSIIEQLIAEKQSELGIE